MLIVKSQNQNSIQFPQKSGNLLSRLATLSSVGKLSLSSEQSVDGDFFIGQVGFLLKGVLLGKGDISNGQRADTPSGVAEPLLLDTIETISRV